MIPVTPLTIKQIDKRLLGLSEWKLNAKKTVLSRSFELPNFIAGLAFVAKITVHAEVMGHHPDVELTYSTVKVEITTHDAKGLTKLDFELAERINRLKVA